MGVAVNLSKFGRIRFVTEDGRLTREAQVEMDVIQQRAGGITGDILAQDIRYAPSGALASLNAQDALDELEAEKQAKDATLTAVAGASTAADKLLYWSGVDVASVCDFTAFGRTLVGSASSSAARTNLGLVIGTNVQAYSANLTTWDGKTAPSGTVVGTSDTQTLSAKTLATPVFTGVRYFQQDAPVNKAAAATLTIAELLTGMIQYSGAGDTLVMPTGTDIDAGVLSGLAVDRAFDFSVVNAGAGTATIGVSAGLLMVGATTVPVGTSGSFRVRKTAANTFIVYRVN